MDGRAADALPGGADPTREWVEAGRYLERHPVTPRQLEVLRIIDVWSRKSGYPPTVRELCALLKLRSTMAVASLTKALERKGLVVRQANRARTTTITAAGRFALKGGR
jgi:SOS-response transcriptional repressor LexA